MILKTFKKPTLLLAALFLLGFSAQAQWRAGVFGGAVWNHYSIDTHYMADLKYRGQWGLQYIRTGE